jgi:hypothetical protein
MKEGGEPRKSQHQRRRRRLTFNEGGRKTWTKLA